jgi:hypothetical protein
LLAIRCLPESGCKGTTIFRIAKTFPRKFLGFNKYLKLPLIYIKVEVVYTFILLLEGMRVKRRRRYTKEGGRGVKDGSVEGKICVERWKTERKCGKKMK